VSQSEKCSVCGGEQDDIIYIDDNGKKYCVECGVRRCEELEDAAKSYGLPNGKVCRSTNILHSDVFGVDD